MVIYYINSQVCKITFFAEKKTPYICCEAREPCPITPDKNRKIDPMAEGIKTMADKQQKKKNPEDSGDSLHAQNGR